VTGRLVVLASGSGTNCQALIDAIAADRLDAQIVAVVTNNADAGVIGRAERAGIGVEVIEHRGRDPEQRRRCDAALIETILPCSPDLVVLAGWMRILGAEVGSRFRIVNLHPALPGELPGIRAIERAFDEWRDGGRDHSGVMVHWVPDDGVDVGPVIIAETVAFEPDDTLESFERRVHETEHRLIVAGVEAALASLDKSESL